MSDCPDCENVGWIDEYAESWDADGNETGEFYRLKCNNWRHFCRPTLGEIAAAIKAGQPMPRPYKGEWLP